MSELMKRVDELAGKAIKHLVECDYEKFEEVMAEIEAIKDMKEKQIEDEFIEQVESLFGSFTEEEMDQSKNNGGKTDYYQLPKDGSVSDFDDFAEWRGFNGNQFNIGKVFWTFNTGRHSGTDYVRDLNKIIHYANREINRVNRESK